MPQQSNNDAYHLHRLYEKPTSPHAYVNQQHSNQTSFDFNQFVVELFRCQTKLSHSTQQLHQQMTEALENIAISSSFQENQHYINDMPIFKAKDPQSFDDWLEQVDKVASLTNKDPYKLTLAKSHGSFSRTITSFPPSMGWNKIKEWLCYNFGSVATKQHAAAMLIDQQLKPMETSTKICTKILNLLFKYSDLLLCMTAFGVCVSLRAV